MAGLQTEFNFTLPKGYVDREGNLHRAGTMRLATARDEIEPLRDPRVADANDPFLTVIVLSRVVTQLGTLGQVTPRDIENLFAADLAFLQDLYGIINFGDAADLEALRRSVEDRPVGEAAPAYAAMTEPEPHVASGSPVEAAPMAPMGQASMEAPPAGDVLGASLHGRRGIEEVRPTAVS
ncbi:MAG: hypothetical protein OEY23_16995 [Acidimicrobiia bacterium]|nr:hypothetical protein [Acidimicrobiia bacterium]